MGSFLEKPETTKSTEYGEGKIGSKKLTYGVTAMQGWRVNMEDTHIHQFGVGGKDLGIFGVFDGHGGTLVSQHIESHLVDEFVNSENFMQVTGEDGKQDAIALGKCITSSFLSLDEKMKELDDVKKGDHSGSTAVLSFISPSHLIVGNCGDSRLIICGNNSVLFSSTDHKPTLQTEQARIENAGGSVQFKRVNGDLAVSRSLGDFAYKTNASLRPEEQQVSAEPDITLYERVETDQFMCIACDGIWDVMDNDSVCSFILEKMNEGYPVESICEELVDHCLEKGSRDNMSVIILTFPGAPDTIGTLTHEEIKSKKARLSSNAVSSTSSFTS